MEEKIVKKSPYSYHTFMYPFSYETDGNREKILEILHNSGWELESFYHTGEEQYENQFSEQYNTYQYLFPIVRPNVFNLKDSSEISQQFIYRLDSSTNKNEFHIVTRPSDHREATEENRTIKLSVNQLKLSLFYKMKIGVLTIETEYFYQNPVWYQGHKIMDSFHIALIINDLGRRLFSPVHDLHNSMTPQSTKMKIYRRNQGKPTEIFTDFTSEHNLLDITNQATCPKLVDCLINGSTEDKSMTIKSILDDRMFAMYIIRDNIYSGKVKDKQIDEIKNALYQFAFCDSSGPTCQNEEMLNEKLLNHTYRRWENYGTIHTVTEYSMGCIVDEGEFTDKIVITPFLTEYVELAKVALAQRAAIVKLEEEAGDISKLLCLEHEAKYRHAGKNNIVQKIRNLWKKYVIFQNELYMPEVTFQEQGVELYSMLKKFLKLEEQTAYLDGELNNLHEIAELENAQQMDYYINLLTIAGTSLAIVAMGQDFLADVQIDKVNLLETVTKSAGIYFLGFIALTFWILHNMKNLSEGDRVDGKPRFHYLGFSIWTLLLVFLMFLFKIITT